MEKEKLALIKESEQKDAKINIRGMRFAFLSLTIFMGITAFALYLDKPWFSGIFGGITILSIMSIFVEVGKNRRKRSKRDKITQGECISLLRLDTPKYAIGHAIGNPMRGRLFWSG